MSGTLTKAHIVDAVAEANGFSRRKSVKTVEIILELIKQSLESGNEVLISGFGKFCVRKKKKRRGRNPSAGKDMILASGRIVTFHCSSNLREKLNRKRATVNKRRAKR